MKRIYESDYAGRSIKAFISYSHEDKGIAGTLKDYLPFEAFLAHEDIEPTEVWQDKILQELQNCDVFLPILTENFTQSKWTDQEIGYSLARNKIIVPLKVSIDPYGFLGKYQALEYNPDSPTKTLERLVQTLFQKEEVREAIADCLIKMFVNSITFKEANSTANILDEITNTYKFSKQQINGIIKAASFNDQVYYGKNALPFADKIYKLHMRQIDEKLVQSFNNTMLYVNTGRKEGKNPDDYFEEEFAEKTKARTNP